MAKDDFADLTPIPRYRGRTVFRLTLLSILALAGAGVAGYYALQLRDERDAQAAELTKQTTVASTCTAELGKLKGQHDTLKGQAEGTEAKRREAETMASTMSADLSATKEELEALRTQRAETEKRVAAFKELTDKFQKMMDSGKIEVKIRNGVMLMALPAEVLFPSGSAALSRPGELAVMEVGVILKQLPNRRFMVVGHTDTQPVKGATYKDNWELSTARAVTVTQFLASVGLSPKLMMAAGHGEHDPVGSNKSKEGREKNRRIEIVLMPDLVEMPPLPKELEETARPTDAAPADGKAPEPSATGTEPEASAPAGQAGGPATGSSEGKDEKK
jgi:chemotaxis protein MotB